MAQHLTSIWVYYMKRIYRENGPQMNTLEAGSVTGYLSNLAIQLPGLAIRAEIAGLIRCFQNLLTALFGISLRMNKCRSFVINVIGRITKNDMEVSSDRWIISGSKSPSRELGVSVKRMIKARNIWVGAIIVLMTVSQAIAQGTPKLDIQISDEKVNLSKEELKNKKLVRYSPGDTLRYVIRASNIGNGLMTNPEIVDPIPAGVTYIAESAGGDESKISFSINQGKAYMDWPPYYTVRNSRGILVQREATPDMVTHIKWNILKNLDPGESTALDFLVVVNK